MDYQRLYEQIPKQPIKWTVNDIQLWLRFIGLSNLYPKFKQLSIDGSCITTLTQQDLRQQLLIQSGIIIKKIMSWVNKGLRQYTSYVQNRGKQNVSVHQIKQVTMKPKFNQPVQSIDIKMTYKNAIKSNNVIPSSQIGQIIMVKEQKQVQQEISVVQQDDDQNKKKQYQLIIQQFDGPQTSFFSVKEEGAKIGRHSSNQILILDQSISRYHAQIKFQGNNFYLKDIGSTTGTFIRIQGRKEIYNKMILQMGSNQFQSILIGNVLQLNVIQGPALNTLIQIPKNKITIGRKTNNQLNFPDDQHLSNIHSSLTYSDNKYYIQDMGTTNGTWQRLSQQSKQSSLHMLNQQTVFKIGSNQIYICKIKTNMINMKVHPNACVICCSQQKDCVYMPCKHNTACIRCSKNLKQCPICRTKIDDYVRIYKS